MIEEELEWLGRPSAMPATAVFSRLTLTRDLLDEIRDEFCAMESSLGLYPAIARLPRQQFDVMVLMYVLHYTMDKTAHIMGLASTTVRSHRDRARLRITRDLQAPGTDRVDD